jgi:glycosyltransferase involved in cell wall biosynthesis
MGVPEPEPRPGARQEIRARHRIAGDAVLFTAFGKVTPEKRVREAMHALAAVTETAPRAHLLVAGDAVDYCDLEAEAEALGVGGRVAFAGYLNDDEIDDHLAASDVCLCMRWPTSRETSASWLRCLAAGKPTISTDLVHTVDVPTLDPRNWSVLEARLKSRPTNEDPEARLKSRPTEEELQARLKSRPTQANPMTEQEPEQEPLADQIGPVGVSIDILDEVHSLKLAIRRLATDEKLRAALGSNARALWAERFRLERMVAGYQTVIARLLQHAPPRAGAVENLPLHLRTSGTEHAESLVREIAGTEYDLRDAD